MKNKYVELKIPIEIITKVEKVKKNAHVHRNIPFSEYLNMLILKAVDDERGRIDQYREAVKISRRKKRGERKVIAFTKNR